ncbi:MAG: RyR domain-containing protein [Planctomycetota bacterium]
MTPSPTARRLWLKQQVRKYAAERAVYGTYADTLCAVLGRACELWAPTGMVQARPKSVASFAEKALRKADKYDDPVHQLTDLCGARVILSTSDELKAICRFIRREFVVDEPNTEDAGKRLKEDEFGYRSIQFVVQLGKPALLGVTTRLKRIGRRKAEIQVRTVAQHAWAAVTHDRLYKGAFAPPARLRRLAHRAAALLEDADEALNDFEGEMQAFLGSYTAYLKPADLAEEIAIAELVLAIDPQPATALRLARLLHAANDLDRLMHVLAPYEKTRGALRLPILVELGAARVERAARTQSAKDRQRGCALLRAAVRTGTLDEQVDPGERANNERKLRATALALLAAHDSESGRAPERYTESLQLDPADPYILCDQLACTIAHTNQPAFLDTARPAVLQALQTCRAHISVGLQLPRAWFTMGRLALLLHRDAHAPDLQYGTKALDLRRDAEALDSYAKAIHFYLADGAPRWRPAEFDAELAYLRQIAGRSGAVRPENNWARHLLRMGFWLKTRPARPIAAFVGGQMTFQYTRGRRVLIIAGGAASEVQSQMESYRNVLVAALDRFDGVVISGGTNAGIPGLVGEVAAKLDAAGRKTFTLIGYRPLFVRSQSGHYDQIVESGQEEVLGLAEPLQMWLDLLASGVDPAAVRLLGINGGRISRFEYVLALTMGALVGLIESSGRSADLVLNDPDWRKHPRLLPLPNDPMTAQAFTRVGASDLPAAELQRMGRIAHEVYTTGVTPDYHKPNTLPWDLLPERYRKSSCDQAAYAFEILRGVGFRITKRRSVRTPLVMPRRFIDPLAEQEHGRWNFERLQAGWRRASRKDDENLRSPYLVPWAELPESVAIHDRQAVEAYPRIFAAGRYRLIPPRRRKRANRNC